MGPEMAHHVAHLTCITSGAIQNGVPITVFLFAIVS